MSVLDDFPKATSSHEVVGFQDPAKIDADGVVCEDSPEIDNSLSLLNRAALIGAGAIVLAEVTPLNETIRGSLTAAAEVIGTSSTTTAAVFAASTFAMEAGAAVATATLLGTKGGQQVTDWVSKKAQKIGIGPDGRQSGVLSDLLIGSTLGSAVAVFSKQAQDPLRSRRQNVRFSIANSAAVTAILSPAVYSVSKSAETVGWENVTVAGLAAGSLAYIGHRIKKSRQPTAEQYPLDEYLTSEGTRYDLSNDELESTEAALVDTVRRKIGRKVCAVWLHDGTEYANGIRTIEAQKFPEMPALMEGVEDASAFLAIVDARRSAGKGRIARATRLNSPLFTKNPPQGSPVNKIGLAKGLVESGQITAEEITEYYNSNRLDLANAISVESNFRIGERSKRVKAIPLSQLAYLAIVRHAVKKTDMQKNIPTVMAHVNEATIKSFKQLGIRHEMFAGRDNLYTPDEAGGFDEKYQPAVYVYEGKTRKTFERIGRFALPELEL